ncbi:MAG: Na+/proline symporter [Chloroflexota bacterium]
MSTADWGIAAAVLTALGMAFLGIAATRGRKPSLDDYITARGSTSSWGSLASVVASVMGAWILFSPAEAATWAGIAGLTGYAVGQAAPVAAYWAVGVRMRRLMPNGHALTEFVWHRYGRPMFLAVLAIVVLYMFTFLAAELGAIARAVQLVTGTPLLVTLMLVAGATLAYTVYGGLRASIVTDGVQFAIIAPLLAVLFVAGLWALGGWDAAMAPVRESAPELLDWGYQPGVDFGITLIIAILAANLFHQGFWQRVYAAESERAVRRGYLVGALVVVPMVMATGMFGLWAMGRGVGGPGAISLFTLALEVLPGWVLVVLVVLALALVMSSIDTLLNGIVSALASGIPGLLGSARTPRRLLVSARWVTVALAVPAIIVGYAFDSVLYLFLIADLVCAGAVVPTFLGLYERHLSGRGALVSTLAGIAVGALFFPSPGFTSWWSWDGLAPLWHVLVPGSTLASFLLALVVSTVVAAIWVGLARGAGAPGFDFATLGSVRALEEEA